MCIKFSRNGHSTKGNQSPASGDININGLEKLEKEVAALRVVVEKNRKGINDSDLDGVYVRI
ncbi:MAG: hypothetical protein LBL18_00470, partial [Bacteroidales bacterium]|nr:hypothetical protein [Bacteroidales bacterium]